MHVSADHGATQRACQRACDDFRVGWRPCVTFDGALPDCDVVVDALFGIGLTRAPDAAASGLIEAINARRCDVLALDVPSGVDADSGHAPGAAIARDATRCNSSPRMPGCATGAALDHCGALHDGRARRSHRRSPTQRRLHCARMPSAAGSRHDSATRHKGNHGHVLCIGGDHGSGGAIVLCAEAALRSGAGLVSVATRSEHVPALLGARPEAMTHAVEDAGDIAGACSQRAERGRDRSRPRTGRLGQRTAGGRAAVRQAAGARRRCVEPARGASACNCRTIASSRRIPGEAARLLGIDTARGASAIVSQRASRWWSVIAASSCSRAQARSSRRPARKPRVVAAGNPGMAIGGMGDVLTGVIARVARAGARSFRCRVLRCAAAFGAPAMPLHATDGERGLAAVGPVAASAPTRQSGGVLMRLELPDVDATEALGACARAHAADARDRLSARRPRRRQIDTGTRMAARARRDGRDPQPDLHTGRALPACRVAPRHCTWTCIGSPAPASWNSLPWTMPGRDLWLVEWPERGAGALPPADLQVDLAVSGAGRCAVLSRRSSAGTAWLAALSKIVACEPLLTRTGRNSFQLPDP